MGASVWEKTWMRGKGGEAEAVGHPAHGSLTRSLIAMCPQALLFLGLNPISASLQDQQCESLSLASNISGKYPDCTPARVQVTTAPPPAPTRVSQDAHTGPCPQAGRAERVPLWSKQFLSPWRHCCGEQDPDRVVGQSCD